MLDFVRQPRSASEMFRMFSCRALFAGLAVIWGPVISGSLFGIGFAQGQPAVEQPRASVPLTFARARALGVERSTLRRQRSISAAAPTQNLDAYAKTIQPILEATCAQCHGDDAQEGNFRVDTLDPDLVRGNDIDWWLELQAVLSNGEMPPPDEVAMADADRAAVVDWLANEVQVASLLRRERREQTSFRRLTQYEFNYALQDLLGLPYDFAKDLPPEAISEDGFQNNSELLHMSVSQFETYRRLARKALLRAIVIGDRPPVLHWGITMGDAGRIDWEKQNAELEKAKAQPAEDPEEQQRRLTALEERFRQPHRRPYYQNLETGRTVAASWGYGGARYAILPTETRREVPEALETIAVLPKDRRQMLTIELGNQVPDEGTMRVRVRASRANADDEGIPTLALLFGWQASNEGRALLPVPDSERAIDAPLGEAIDYQWDVPLGELYPRNSVRKTSPMGAMPNPSEYIRLVNSSVSQGPIRIEYVEIAAPVYDQWPPDSHQRIFVASEHQGDEAKYAREILTKFMPRAWRRPVSEPEIDKKVRLFATMRPECDSFAEVGRRNARNGFGVTTVSVYPVRRRPGSTANGL